jgi:hypothetical protein
MLWSWRTGNLRGVYDWKPPCVSISFDLNADNFMPAHMYAAKFKLKRVSAVFKAGKTTYLNLTTYQVEAKDTLNILDGI